MAVQAQHPSNLFPLKRSVQEGPDYSIWSQPPGFLDQSTLLNIQGTYPKKRGREIEANANNNNPTITMNPFPFQPQSPNLIHLSHLHNHQLHHNIVSTGLRLSFDDQQSLHHTLPSDSFTLFSQNIAHQIKHHRDEIDRFLQTQAEQLRRTLAEKRNRHYRALLCAAEESVAHQLREKETQLENSTRRNAELEARAATLAAEAHAWQAKVRTQETVAASLKTQLQQALMLNAQDSRKGDQGPGVVEGQLTAVEEDAESAYVDPNRLVVADIGPACRACRRRAAAVLLLPCRHLCLCTVCDEVAQACPVCLTMRSSSVEVFFT